MLYRYIGCRDASSQQAGRDKKQKTKSKQQKQQVCQQQQDASLSAYSTVLFLAGCKFAYFSLLPSFITCIYQLIARYNLMVPTYS